VDPDLIMTPKLKTIYDAMAIYQQSYPEDACLVLSDLEHIIGYLPGQEIDLKLTPGEPLLPKYAESVMAKALSSGQSYREERGSEFRGMAYIGTATPIYENGSLVGVLSVVMSNHQLDVLRREAAELTAAVEEMSATTDEVTHSSSEVANRLQELSTEADVMSTETKKVHAVLALVESIADQSHLLGLNAAIEAARAGENGRGFSVVADEIRKMAQHSRDSVQDIQTQLGQILTSIERMSHSITDISSFTQEHSASMQELNMAYQHITRVADELMQLSESSS
jgi:hypothetical protein